MIVKLKRESGWVFLDQVELFETYGYIGERIENDAGLAGVPTFADVAVLRPAVDRVWGDRREFDRELWPELVPDREAYVESGVARLSDGRNVLVLWADEAFLLSESGDTIDRLR